jgi:WD40 repeat protein
LASGDDGGAIRFLDARTTDESARMDVGSAVNSLAFGPDGKLLASGSSDGSVRVIDSTTRREIARFQQESAIYTLAFSLDGTRLAFGGQDGTAQVVDPPSGNVFEQLCTNRVGRNLTREEWQEYIGEDEEWRPTCPDWRTVEE